MYTSLLQYLKSLNEDTVVAVEEPSDDHAHHLISDDVFTDRNQDAVSKDTGTTVNEDTVAATEPSNDHAPHLISDDVFIDRNQDGVSKDTVTMLNEDAVVAMEPSDDHAPHLISNDTFTDRSQDTVSKDTDTVSQQVSETAVTTLEVCEADTTTVAAGEGTASEMTLKRPRDEERDTTGGSGEACIEEERPDKRVKVQDTELPDTASVEGDAIKPVESEREENEDKEKAPLSKGDELSSGDAAVSSSVHGYQSVAQDSGNDSGMEDTTVPMTRLDSAVSEVRMKMYNIPEGGHHTYLP